MWCVDLRRRRADFWAFLIAVLMLLPAANGASSLTWEERAGHRFAQLPKPADSKPGFKAIPASMCGITFSNRVDATESLRRSVINNGSGVAAGDVDGDGLPDLFFCGVGGRSALYKNLGGWRFEDITDRAGVACEGLPTTGVLLADVDGDGDLDLLVSSIGSGVRLFLNDGHAHFSESAKSGLLKEFGAMSMAMADVDRDGDLDLYVTNYRTTTIQDEPGTRFSLASENGRMSVRAVNGRPVKGTELEGRFDVGAGGEILENGEPDILYLNNGQGVFTPVDWTAGFFRDAHGQALRQPPRDWGLSAAFRDLNHDGFPDLYVCNDSESSDRLWLSDGLGHLLEAGPEALRTISLSSMGVDFADLDGDGWDDFIVLDMLARDHRHRQTQQAWSRPAPSTFGEGRTRLQNPRNTLFLSRGDGTFAEIAFLAGLHAADWAWTPIFLDVDLDGREDLLISSGFHRDVRDRDQLIAIAQEKAASKPDRDAELALRRRFPQWPTRVHGFRNAGDLRFEDAGERWGLDQVGVHQGMATVDLDQDGDLDLVINRFGDAPLLLRNEASAPRVLVRLRGVGKNGEAIGSRLTMRSGDLLQTQEWMKGGRYLSCDEAVRVFARPNGPAALEIQWPSGMRTRVDRVESGRIYEVWEPLVR